MTPLETALNNYVCRKAKDSTDNLVCQDSFIAGWDARNEQLYGKASVDIEKCKEFLSEISSLQFSNGYANKANDLLKELCRR